MGVDAEQFFPFSAWQLAVEFGPVPSQLPEHTLTGPQLQATSTEVLVDLGVHGRMLASADGVRLDLAPTSTLGDIAPYLYGSVPQMVRVMREQYALHGSGVAGATGGIAIVGYGFAGKSTTAMGLVRRGYRLIVDDVLPVDFGGETAVIHGWERPLHLRAPAAAHFGIEAHVPNIDRAPGLVEPAALRLIVEIVPQEDATEVSVVPITGAERFRVVACHADSANLSSMNGRQRTFFAWCVRVAESTPMIRVTRPADGWHLDEVLDIIERRSKLEAVQGSR